MGLPDQKWNDELCDMNLLFLGNVINCCVCDKIIDKDDKTFWNHKTGIVIHSYCYYDQVIKNNQKGVFEFDN